MPSGLSRNLLRAALLHLAILLPFSMKAAGTQPDEDGDPAPPPKLVIRGLGVFGNLKLDRMILRTYGDEVSEQPFDANFIEDAFVVLRNQLRNDGYLEAVIRATLTLVDGTVIELDWDGRTVLDVPRPLAVQEARFEIGRGPLFFYDSFGIDGVGAITGREATRYFVPTDMLLRLKADRRFSQARLARSIGNLRQELINLGYRDATVTIGDLRQDKDTGAVSVVIVVDEGRLHEVGSVNVVVMDPGGTAVVDSRSAEPGVPWSPQWEQDFGDQLRREHFARGHPDARVQLNPADSEEREGVLRHQLEAVVHPGPEVRLGDVRFEGQQRTRESFLRRKGRVEGPLLDRLEVDAARERLSRQGVFNFVGVRFEPDTGPERDVVFELEEGRRVDFSLLAGYGSYDQVFAGAELDQYNLWGIGHNARLRGMLSSKTVNVIYTYGIPEFLATGLGLYGNIDGLLREELTFERQEIKSAIGLRQEFPGPRLQLGLRYSYQFLKTEDSPDAEANEDFTRVAAVILDVQLDRRDNPLAPRRGFRLFGNLEVADPSLGSEATYQSIEFGAAGHLPLQRGLVLHGAVQHGVIFSRDPANDLPFNKRFLPGGENTVRGFQRGGASPYDDAGRQLGAETTLLTNFELEQYLTERWSVVAFVDGAGVAADLADYPFDEWLWSVGGGIRWNTVIGPVRVEYGYNLNPRSFDPDGTLHVSIGFPF